MPVHVLRKYGSVDPIYFELIDFGMTDFEATPVTPGAADAVHRIDGGSSTNVGTEITHVGGGMYKWTPSAASRTQGKSITVNIRSTASPKLWEDQLLTIDTYGNASALMPFDLSTAMSGQAVSSVTGAVGSVTGAVGSVTGAVGSVTGNVGGNVVGNVNGNVAGSVGSVTGNVGGSVASVTTVNDKAGYALSNAGIDALWVRQLVESYAAAGAAPTMAQAIMLLVQAVTDLVITGTSGQIMKLDGTTAAATLTYDDATNPTERHRTS